MAVITILSLFTLLFPILLCSAETTVDISTHTETITDGGILAIECKIQNMQDVYTVNIFRVRNDITEQITTGSHYAPESPLGQRVFLSQRTLDGTIIFFLTVLDFTVIDEGEYFCHVFEYSRGNFLDIGKASIIIRLSVFPDNMYPLCESEPPQPIVLRQHTLLRMSCSSERGVPPVEIKWSSNRRSIRLSPQSTSEYNMIVSKISLNTDDSYDGAYFECAITSPGFPERDRSCMIGPITIIFQNQVTTIEEDRGVIVVSDKHGAIDMDRSNLVNCDKTCSPENESTIFYLIISTSGATILWITFLTTTYIACYQYNSASTVMRNAHTDVYDTNDGSDPVYVSLQRRQGYERNSMMSERNSMYMTLEDPTNPGSKIMMPKEVFDEFYSTLTIRKV